MMRGFYPSLDALLKEQTTQVEEILPGVRRGQVAGLVSITNIGKTTLLLNLSLSLAAGESWPPFLLSASEPRRVMFIDFEATAAELRADTETMLQRISNREAALKNFIPIVDAFYSDEPLQLSKPTHFDRIVSYAQSYKVDLVIVDTCGAAFNVKDENANAEVTRCIMKPLNTLARKANCGVWFSHHHGKPNENSNSDSAYYGRGASAFGALSRSIYTLASDWKKGEGYVVLKCAKSKGFTFEPTLLRLNPETRWFEVCDVRHDTKQAGLTAQDIADYVKEKGQAHSDVICQHFAARTSERTIRDRIKEAADIKLIVKPKKNAPWSANLELEKGDSRNSKKP